MNRLRILIAILLLSQSSNLNAQVTTNEIKALTEMLEAEKRQIAELQAEIERRNTALQELSARVQALAGGTEQVVSTPTAQAAESNPPRFDFYGELVTRVDTLHQEVQD